MRKLAAYAAAAMIAAVCLTAPLLIAPELTYAQDPGSLSGAGVVVAPAPAADVMTIIRPALAELLMGVLSLLGLVVAYYARKIGGAQAEAVANGAYQILIDQAAGWLLGEKKEGRTPSIDDAVNYLRGSYPEVVKHEPSAAKLGDDIIGAIGRLKG